MLFFTPSLQPEGPDVLLGPEVTCGPSDVSVSSPFALTIPHCAEVNSEHWNIHLKKRTQQGKWEVRSHFCSHLKVIYTKWKHDGC